MMAHCTFVGNLTHIPPVSAQIEAEAARIKFSALQNTLLYNVIYSYCPNMCMF